MKEDIWFLLNRIAELSFALILYAPIGLCLMLIRSIVICFLLLIAYFLPRNSSFNLWVRPRLRFRLNRMRIYLDFWMKLFVYYFNWHQLMKQPERTQLDKERDCFLPIEVRYSMDGFWNDWFPIPIVNW